MDWAERVDDDVENQLTLWRRHLHAIPEVGFEEHKTTAFIVGLLQEWDVPFERPLPTGVVATIRGAKPGPTIAVRCDIDGLPIQEENDFDFASTIPGRMHACGHDGHTAIQLGLTRILSDLRNEVRGEIRLLFQPAEEVLESGARKFIEQGVLAGVDAIVGLHLMSGLDVGKISLRGGAIMASMDQFTVTVLGTGGHGAFPHQTRDSLVIAASLVGELQTLVSRRIDPLEPAVVTVGALHAGTVFNVIGSRAELTGTVRTLSPTVRDLIETEMQKLVVHHASALGAEANFEYLRGSPPLVNDESLIRLLRPAAVAAVGDGRVVSMAPIMGGEDFAHYLQVISGGYAFVGARNSEVGADWPHHHPRFTIDEASLPIGLRYLLNAVEGSSSLAGGWPSAAERTAAPTGSL